MLSTGASPAAWRVAVAFVAAPLVVAVGLAWAEPPYGGPDRMRRVVEAGIAYALVGAYPPALLLGVPAFLALRRRLRPTALNCMLVGAAVAALPWLLLGPLLPGSDDATIMGRATRIDGRTTPWGWFLLARFVAMTAGAGAVGGAVFWLTAAARMPRWPPRRT